MDMQVSHAAQSGLAGPLDPDDVMSWFLELVLGYRVAIGSVFYRVSIRFNGNRLSAVSKIPFFLAIGCTKGSYLENDLHTNSNPGGRPVFGMNRRW